MGPSSWAAITYNTDDQGDDGDSAQGDIGWVWTLEFIQQEG